MNIHISSPAFANGGTIPCTYSGQGDNISPPLAWDGAPLSTKSYALIVDDPDAPVMTFTHWVLFNVPPTTTGLPEKVPTEELLPDGSVQGKNSFLKTGYGGPLPPTKKPHRYHFHLYALDTELDLKPRASKKEVLKAIEGHVLAEGELVGIYQKQ